ncbi:MAG TPA: NADP-dependent oxidoreductase [Pseudomonadales bacterium]|nr:NADP-dependent oxidoreductase [Pseudomonadales bacterium]
MLLHKRETAKGLPIDNQTSRQVNRQWTLVRTPPAGWPTEGDFSFDETTIPQPGPGQLTARTIYLSMDPYQWGRRRSGVERIGDVCHGRTVSVVMQSRHEDYVEGDIIFNTNGWQEYGLVGEDVSVFNYMFPRKIDPALAPVSTAIGVLGMLGLTAYSGVYLQCQPQPGETVVVSAASGGVGQNAGQIAKIKGCRVIGIAGSDEKCRFVEETLGFSACINRNAEDFPARLAAACPDGVDIYFESAGGMVFEAVLPLFNKNSRITLCGLISQYGNEEPGSGQENWKRLGQPVFDRLNVTVHGLFVGNFVKDYQEAFLADMSGWIKDGLVRYKEDLWQGLENAPDAFSALLKGGNFSKTLVQVGEDPTLDEATRQHRESDNVLGGSR